MITHILVLAALLSMEDRAPRMIAPHKSEVECLQAAGRANKDHADELNTDDSKALGLKFVCMKLVVPSV